MRSMRQGDVLITEIKGIPKGQHESIKPDTRNRLVLAEGEATGHAHTLPMPSIGAALVEPVTTDIVVRLDTEASVTHDEHEPITLAPGAYRVRRQREYSPAEIRNVAD